MFATTSFVKSYYLNLKFYQVLQSTPLKNYKDNLLKKDASHLKIPCCSNRQKKNIRKRERKTKNENKPNKKNNYFFTFTFLYRKVYILLENIFGKTQYLLLHLYQSLFEWQVIGNAVIKHRRPFWYTLVLQMPHFHREYLTINQVF